MVIFQTAVLQIRRRVFVQKIWLDQDGSPRAVIPLLFQEPTDTFYTEWHIVTFQTMACLHGIQRNHHEEDRTMNMTT